MLSPVLKEELKGHLNTYNFHGVGGSEMPYVITFHGLILLCMYLPGLHAKRNRGAMASVLCRHFAGDKRLIEEIIRNSESESMQGVVTLVTAVQTEEDQIKIQMLKTELAIKEAKLHEIRVRTRILEETHAMKKQKKVAVPTLEDPQPKGVCAASEGTSSTENVRDFLIGFIEQAPQDPNFTNVKASKLFEAYRSYEAKHNNKGEAINTRFGREVKTMTGVSKWRTTAGWVYRLNHVELRAHLNA